MAIKHGLGRGLGALIRDDASVQASEKSGDGILQVPVERMRRNTLQPRQDFDADALAELANSIRKRGVLQPLLVRAAGDGYELIAGERRLRAAMSAGLKQVPVIVMDAAESDTLELALIENLQREDLNILEEAHAYRELSEKFGLKQEQVAERVGKARASVANTLRILSLPEAVRQFLARGELSPGHAKVLLSLEIPEEQIRFARHAVKDSLSVRNLEKLVQKSLRVPRKPRVSQPDMPASHLSYLSDKLHAHFGTSVRIDPCRTYANGKKGKGCVQIDFYSNDDLDRILQLMGVSEE